MFDKEERLKEMLKHMELFKQSVMMEINVSGLNDETIRRTKVYSMAEVEPLIINDYSVFRFGYEGILPIYKEDDYEYLSMIRHYYYRATFDSYDYSKLELPVMTQATIIFVHYFKNKQINDLDNRNRKYVQDAIKMTGIINDDRWRNVWNMDIAFFDGEKNHLQVYVVPTGKIQHFIGYLIENHKNMSSKYKEISAYEEEYFSLKREKEEKKKEEALKNSEKIKMEEKFFY